MKDKNAADVFLTIAGAAVRANRSTDTIRRWIRHGLLPAERDKRTRHVRIAAADVDAVLGCEPVAVAPAAG